MSLDQGLVDALVEAGAELSKRVRVRDEILALLWSEMITAGQDAKLHQLQLRDVLQSLLEFGLRELVEVQVEKISLRILDRCLGVTLCTNRVLKIYQLLKSSVS
jgi:hypothetical protein